MVRGSNLSFNYTGIPVFDRASFSIGSGQKVALVGPNGAGKSTLFGLIAGTLESEEGSVVVEGSVALVPQEVKQDPILDSAESIRAYIDPHQRYPDHELENWLRGLELGHLSLADVPLSLSGGQKTRLALARALLLKPDVLLLDEPTNFLDENGKKWVMQLLHMYPKTLLIVSHDIALLNTAIDKVLAINIHTKKIDEYSGTYDQFVRLKKEADDLLKRTVLNERKHIARMKKGLRNMDRYTSEKGVRQRTRLKKRIRLLEENLPSLPRGTASIRLRLPEPARVGEIPLMARNIYKSYGGDAVLKGVSLTLYRNERVALLGKNGAGKSTLIKILVGLQQPDSGEVIRDESLSLGYYSQEFESFDLEQTLIESLYAETSGGDHIIRPLLARFLFTGQKVFNKIKTLSGGEKTRLAIARLLLKNYNLLVLDEPTTYLDPLSQRVILEALKNYTGGILVVSHTAQFLHELAPSRVLLLPEQQISTWNASLLSHAEEV